MRVYCNGELATMRIWGRRWTCDLCGKKLWRGDMAKRKKLPEKDAVAIAYVYPGFLGFRFTCRDHEGKVIYDSPNGYKSRYQARDEIKRLWPQAKVSFEVI